MLLLLVIHGPAAMPFDKFITLRSAYFPIGHLYVQYFEGGSDGTSELGLDGSLNRPSASVAGSNIDQQKRRAYTYNRSPVALFFHTLPTPMDFNDQLPLRTMARDISPHDGR
jgi:hypothetical protein